MAITYVGASNASVNGTSWSNPVPASTQIGDFLLLVVSLRGSGSAQVPTPSGWQIMFGQPRGSAGAVLVFCRVATGGTPAPALTCNVSNTHLSSILTFRGVDATSPNMGASYDTGSVSGTTHPVPATYAAVAGCMIVRTAVTSGSTGQSFTWPSPAFERVGYSGGLAIAHTVSLESRAAAGAVPGMNATCSGNGGTYGTSAIVLAPTLSRLNLGSTPVPLMLGNTEVEIMGP